MTPPLPDDDVQAFLARCQQEWSDAGLPDHVTDPNVLERVAVLVDSDTRTESVTTK
jgi:hypothetical protein